MQTLQLLCGQVFIEHYTDEDRLSLELLYDILDGDTYENMIQRLAPAQLYEFGEFARDKGREDIDKANGRIWKRWFSELFRVPLKGSGCKHLPEESEQPKYSRLYWNLRYRQLLADQTLTLEKFQQQYDFFLKHPKAIDSVQMNGRTLQPDHFQYIQQQPLPQITEIAYHHPMLRQPKQWLESLRFLQKCHDLRVFALYHSRIVKSNHLQELAQYCDFQALQSLELRYCHLHYDAHEVLGHILIPLRQTLVELNVQYSLTDDAAGPFLEEIGHLEQLKRLTLEGNGLSDASISRLVVASNNTSKRKFATLQHLNLSHNEITATGIGILCRQLFQGNEQMSLRSLDVNTNEIGGEGMEHLISLFGNCLAMTTLEKLNLNQCDIIGKDCVTKLLQAITRLKSLKYLDLGCNVIGSTFGDELANVLQQNIQLQHLGLQYVGLLERGCSESFCRALESHPHLLHLDISENSLGNTGACKVFKDFFHKTTSASASQRGLNLSGNRVNVYGIQQMVELATFASSKCQTDPTRQNEATRMGCCLDLRNNSFGSDESAAITIRQLRECFDTVYTSQ